MTKGKHDDDDMTNFRRGLQNVNGLPQVQNLQPNYVPNNQGHQGNGGGSSNFNQMPQNQQGGRNGQSGGQNPYFENDLKPGSEIIF